MCQIMIVIMFLEDRGFSYHERDPSFMVYGLSFNSFLLKIEYEKLIVINAHVHLYKNERIL